MVALSIAGQINEQIEQALAPLLAVNGGYLKELKRFRGTAKEFKQAYWGVTPAGFVGVTNCAKAGSASPVYTCSLMLADGSLRGEEERVEGSGVASESVGLYQMCEDACELLEGLVLRLTGVAAPTDPLEGLRYDIIPNADEESDAYGLVTIQVQPQGAPKAARFKSRKVHF